MIVDERLVTYINSLDTGNTEILDEIEREALETYVPIVRKEMQSFLKRCCISEGQTVISADDIRTQAYRCDLQDLQL